MRLKLKLAIVATGIRHQALAFEANKLLPAKSHISELDVTKLVTARKNPSVEQAVILSRLLKRSVRQLFPEVKP